MIKKIYLLMFISLFAFSACAKSKIVDHPAAPYESLGTLELKVSNQYSVLKYLTLGIKRQRSFEDMTRSLDKALAKEARKKYGADAVANVTYWPGVNSGAEINYLYARGEMIRFKKFTEAVSTVEDALPVTPAAG